MAEINVERKRPTIWPWVVGIVALLAVLWIWGAATDDERPAEFATTTEPEPGAPAGTAGMGGGAVDEYAEFAGVTGGGTERGEMGPDHEYTAEGIRKLRAALRTVVDRDGNAEARARFDRFGEVADRIEQDPKSGQHASLVRDAFTRAADVIASLDKAQGAENVKSTAESISPDQPLLEQREKVHRFFRESAQAIQTAARS